MTKGIRVDARHRVLISSETGENLFSHCFYLEQTFCVEINILVF